MEGTLLLMSIDPNRITSMIKSIASNTGRLFPGYTEASDIEGELWVWLLENKETVRRYDEEEGGERTLAFVMKQKAMTYANSLKAAKLGYSPDDIVGYGVKQLKVLLEDVFEYENWESAQVDYSGTPKSRRIEPTGDRVTSLIDVKSGLEKLDDRNYNILIARFKYGYTDQQMADLYELSLSSISTTVNRAVRALSNLLSSPQQADPPQRRAVMSNAAARAALSNNYEG